ncbi:hypothetical protein NDU88_011957 [Pleurodeles waltl]|uniref:Uncharacterized protein n=1 Tax=Pleurodeles waltl TaxID=8319 RepID=A0AAV7S7R4_PLEWA|nr:hypothetical protein NDU88_011957 [Pleurodeles waltl]
MPLPDNVCRGLEERQTGVSEVLLGYGGLVCAWEGSEAGAVYGESWTGGAPGRETAQRSSKILRATPCLTRVEAKINKELMALQVKVDDLDARSHRNNLRIVGVAESTDINSMESYEECLLFQLLGRDTFSCLSVVERAHHSLAARLPLRPITAK